MPSDHDIAQLLAGLGYGVPADAAKARAHLEARGLTRPGKLRISDEKRPRVEAALAERFAVLCANPLCAKAAAGAREVIQAVPRARCEHCGGSDNRQALLRLESLAAREKMTKFVVVGGSPAVRDELRALKPAAWTMRLIDGTQRRTQRDAQADLDWADLILVWGGSELDHKVSHLYTDATGALRKKVVLLAKRGVAALLHAAADHLEK